jgi:polyribonucleotide nucleotidyltransferase
MKEKTIKSCEFANQKITFEIGELAPRTNASVLASMGDTVVLATVTISREDSDRDYFPLSVEYIEKFYAGGVISGSRFVKRERFPSEEAILKARMIDRSLRPLFSQDIRRDLQIVITVLSYDEENDPGILGLNAASAAVTLSEIPFEGPVAGVRIGLEDGKFILNPTDGQLEKSDMDFVISTTDKAIVMIDAGANEVDEETAAKAFDFAMENSKPLLQFQEEVQKELGKKKIEIEGRKKEQKLNDIFIKRYGKVIDEVIYELKGNIPGEKRSIALGEIINEFTAENEGTYSKLDVSSAIEQIVKNKVRDGILEKNKRPSHRAMNEIREIKCKVGILPRTHGSAFFSRGITQALSIVTLGSTRLEQTLESFEGEETKRFMHHYNGPSYSVGEAGKYNYYPGRREIGHGALVEKALRPVIPPEEEFPYTIRVVSEILSQQGSSSMAAACGSTLALMDAGIPIKRPVAGIAIGLVTSKDGKKHIILTDVQDLEDFYGDMDFKVTGTEKGVTAIQMDNKLKGIKVEILKEALKEAKRARMKILEKMKATLPASRKSLSKHAPKITTIEINPSKIAELIGPGGKVIRKIIEETGAEIDIKDDGLVHIAAVTDEARDKALKMVKDIVEEAEVGKVYTGLVSKIVPYGAFVDVSPAISGLVHVSEIAEGFVSDPSKFIKEGQEVKVKVIGIDDEGRINFSIKRAKKEENKRE